MISRTSQVLMVRLSLKSLFPIRWHFKWWESLFITCHGRLLLLCFINIFDTPLSAHSTISSHLWLSKRHHLTSIYRWRNNYTRLIHCRCLLLSRQIINQSIVAVADSTVAMFFSFSFIEPVYIISSIINDNFTALTSNKTLIWLSYHEVFNKFKMVFR